MGWVQVFQVRHSGQGKCVDHDGPYDHKDVLGQVSLLQLN